MQDYAADYRAAVQMWAQTDTSKVTLPELVTSLFPQYASVAHPEAPPDDDVYEWTAEDRKVFDRILANLKD